MKKTFLIFNLFFCIGCGNSTNTPFDYNRQGIITDTAEKVCDGVFVGVTNLTYKDKPIAILYNENTKRPSLGDSVFIKTIYMSSMGKTAYYSKDWKKK